MKKSAGILVYRKIAGSCEVFLVHPGGPFWKNKDEHAWSVPKGEFTDDENPLAAALREFQEETGFSVAGPFTEFSPVRQRGGKIVYIWAVEANLNPADIKSNTFSMEWPPHSGKLVEMPEIDRAEWFPVEIARHKIHKGQVPVLDQLIEKIIECGDQEST
jgi:predicted NUDIX family NTP pyrophosphohydrolase